MIRFFTNTLRWALGEIREKLDIPGTIQEIKALGKKHGRRFLIFAIAWEIIEDVIFPGLSIYYGMPEMVAFFLIFHFEIVAYPVALWVFRMWDRVRGIEPWDPDRVNTSTYLRTTLKAGIYWTLTATALHSLTVWALLPDTVLFVLYALLATFGFVHERIWNDHNHWIDETTDEVHPTRNLAKATTYTFVTTLLIASFLNAAGFIPWARLLLAQGVVFLLYWLWERGWAGVEWGLRPTTRAARKHEDR